MIIDLEFEPIFGRIRKIPEFKQILSEIET
jgi:hypothetical protein